MDIKKYLTVEEQLLLRNIRHVPAVRALLDAARRRIEELQKQAIDKAGTIEAKELEQLLIRAQGLQWIVDLPDKIEKTINSEV